MCSYLNQRKLFDLVLPFFVLFKNWFESNKYLCGSGSFLQKDFIMSTVDVEKVFAKMKDMIVEELKKFNDQEYTDEMVKEQIAKGWMPTKNALNKNKCYCFNCSNNLNFEPSFIKETFASKCPRCGNEMTI